MGRKLLLSRKYLILIGMMMSLFSSNQFKIIGYIGIAILFLCIFFSAKRIRIDNLCKIALICLLYLYLRFILQIMTGNVFETSIRSLILQTFVYFFIIFVRNSNVSLEAWKWIFVRFSIYVLGMGLYLWLTHQLAYSSFFSTLFGNYAMIGFGLCMILFNLYEEKRYKIVILIIMAGLFVITFFSEMRSAAIGELLSFAYMFYSSLRNSGKRFNRFIFVVVVAICFFVPYLYLELYNPSFLITRNISTFIQRIVLSISGSRLFSGRNTLWLAIIPVLKNNPLLGLGIGFTPSMVSDYTFSTHNLFLFLRMEQGFIGLFLFIILLYKVWNNYFLQERNKTKFAAQAFMLMVLIQQTFSLGLIGGKGAFSFIAWTVLISLTKKEGVKNDLTKNRKIVF